MAAASSIGDRMNRIESEIGLLNDDVGTMKESCVEHRMRLENGSKVFESWHKRIADIERRTQPKEPNLLKVIGLTLAIFSACAGGLWGLAQMLRDRPTTEQVERVLEKQVQYHENTGHGPLRRDVQAIKEEQAAARILIKGLQTGQDEQGKKLDRVLDRLPVLKKKRKP